MTTTIPGTTDDYRIDLYDEAPRGDDKCKEIRYVEAESDDAAIEMARQALIETRRDYAEVYTNCAGYAEYLDSVTFEDAEAVATR